MQITVDIRPELQAEIAAQARARGMDVPAYAATLIEEGARIPSGAPKRLSQAELEAALAEIAQFSHKIPSLPDEALSRESLYRDHD